MVKLLSSLSKVRARGWLAANRMRGNKLTNSRRRRALKCCNESLQNRNVLLGGVWPYVRQPYAHTRSMPLSAFDGKLATMRYCDTLREWQTEP